MGHHANVEESVFVSCALAKLQLTYPQLTPCSLIPMKYLKISIITPSYNQGKFIERTIQSVLDQNYPNLEYIILDSLSTDNTPTILKKYSKKAKIIIKKDKGQSDAINKGMKIAKGEIIGYLNSDDTLEPGALYIINDFFTKNPRARCVTGICNNIDPRDRKIKTIINFIKNNIPIILRYKFSFLFINNFINQPSTFWHKKVIKKIGYFDQKLNFAMDYDYFLRIAQKYTINYIPYPLANFRLQPSQKSANYSAVFNEVYEISNRYNQSPTIKFLALISCKLSIFGYYLLKLLHL